MKLGEKIRNLRKKNKLTQEELAEKLNVSPQAVSKWETGASSPDVDMLVSLAAFFRTTVDELLDFDRRRIDAEVAALVTESVPLRSDPARAEAFYRKALERYPNHEVLLNCLLMVIPDERAKEKIALGQRLLDCTADEEIRLDVLRLLALTYARTGEQAMADACLDRLPELYFLKTAYAAFLREGPEGMEALRRTEQVCMENLAAMLALRARRRPAERETWRGLALRLLDLYRAYGEPDAVSHADLLEELLGQGVLLDEVFC